MAQRESTPTLSGGIRSSGSISPDKTIDSLAESPVSLPENCLTWTATASASAVLAALSSVWRPRGPRLVRFTTRYRNDTFRRAHRDSPLNRPPRPRRPRCRGMFGSSKEPPLRAPPRRRTLPPLAVFTFKDSVSHVADGWPRSLQQTARDSPTEVTSNARYTPRHDSAHRLSGLQL